MISFKTLNLLKISKFKKTIYTFFITFNPIVLTQLTSFMIDGIIYSIFIITICSAILFCNDRKNKIYLLLLISNGIILLSSKFTCFAIVGILCFFFCFYSLIFERNLKYFIQNISISSLIFIIGIGIVNFNPYFTNIKEDLNPMHPVFGEKKVDILVQYRPKELSEYNRFQQFFTSVFSKTGSPGLEIEGIKNPFMIYKKELNRLADTDIGFGGFGVFYGLFLISLFLIFIYTLFKIKKIKKTHYLLLFLSLMLFCTTFIIPETWWARIICNFWILPILIMLFIDLLHNKNRILYIPKFILIFNILIFIPIILIMNVFWSLQINHTIKELSYYQNKKIALNNNFYNSHEIMLIDNKILYILDKNLEYNKH